MVKGLLPEDLIASLLEQTGAYNGGQASHLFDGITRPFDFAPKRKSDFSFDDFDEPLEILASRIAQDFKNEYYLDVAITRRPLNLAEAKKYRFRESSLCATFKADVFAEPLVVYFGYRTFFFIYNTFLGGASIPSDKGTEQLSDVEHKVFEEMQMRLSSLLTDLLKTVYEVNFKLDRSEVKESDQRSFLSQEYLLADYSFADSGTDYPFAILVPRVLIEMVQEKKAREAENAKGKTDPSWKKVVTDAVMHSVVDLVVHLGQTQMNFADSINIKVGDVVMWDKENTEVQVRMGSDVRFVGAIGVIEGQFAIRVDHTF